jgi:micrococcal nuclease
LNAIRKKHQKGRLLRYVYVDDVFVNEVLVEEGYAISKTYKPDTKHQLELDIAEAKAQKNNVGLWANCKK